MALDPGQAQTEPVSGLAGSIWTYFATDFPSIAYPTMPAATTRGIRELFESIANGVADAVNADDSLTGYHTVLNGATAVTERHVLKVDGTLVTATDDGINTVLDTPGLVPITRQVLAGTGLSGGGVLSGDVTISMPNVGMGAGTYSGGVVNAIEVDDQGRVIDIETGNLYYQTIKDTDGVAYTQRSVLRFDTGFHVADNGVETVITVTGGGGGSGYDTIQNNGTSVTQRSTINLMPRLVAADVSTKTTIDLASGIVSPGTYTSVTVDTYGRVTAGSSPTIYYQTVKDSSGSAATQRPVFKFNSDFSISDVSSETVVALSSDSLTVNTGNGLQGGSSITLGSSATIDLRLNSSGGLTKTLGGSSNELGITALGVTNAMLAGSIDNTKLSNSSLTVTAGSGLTGGGSVSLGSSTTLSIDIGGVTDAMLAGSISNAKLSNSSVTVNTGNGLSGGGSISLGSSRTIDLDLYSSGGLSKTLGTGTQLGIAASGVSNAMLANSSITINTGNGLSGGTSISLGSSATVDLRLNASGGLTKTLGGSSNELGIAALGVTNAMLAGSIDNAKLSNSSITVTASTGLSGGGSVSLGSSTSLSVDQSFSPTWTGAHIFNNIVDMSAGATKYRDGSSAAISASSTGRIRYNDSTHAFEVSVNGGSYSAVKPSSGQILPRIVPLGFRNSWNYTTPFIVASASVNASDYALDGTTRTATFRVVAATGVSGSTAHAVLYNVTDSETVCTLNITSVNETKYESSLTIGTSTGNLKTSEKIYECRIYIDSPASTNDTVELYSAEIRFTNTY